MTTTDDMEVPAMESDWIDPELIGHRLDLGRPELRPILDRYAPRTALIVARRTSAAHVKDALTAEGWRVHECEGPGRVRCPLLEGKPCAVRESADVAVVYVDGKATSESGLLPRLRCAADGPSPAVIALDGRLDPPTIKEGYGVVGALRDSQTIVKAVTTLAVTDTLLSQDDEAT